MTQLRRVGRVRVMVCRAHETCTARKRCSVLDMAWRGTGSVGPAVFYINMNKDRGAAMLAAPQYLVFSRELVFT